MSPGNVEVWLSMSTKNFEEECPKCHESNVDVVEYDGDLDMYLLKCLEDGCTQIYWVENDDDVWK